VSALSDYLNEHLPPEWTKPQVVEALAGSVDRATVYRYLSGNHPRRPSDAILKAFAAILPGATVRELRAAAASLNIEGDPWVPPVEANRLNGGQRAALSAFIRATVSWQERFEADEGLDEEPTRQVNIPANARAEMRKYIAELQASGMSSLADRVAATLAISSASETASKSSKE
jgi:hypothetical protein